MMKNLTNQADLCYLYTRTRFPLLTERCGAPQCRGEEGLADMPTVWAALYRCVQSCPFFVKEELRYEV